MNIVLFEEKYTLKICGMIEFFPLLFYYESIIVSNVIDSLVEKTIFLHFYRLVLSIFELLVYGQAGCK